MILAAAAVLAGAVAQSATGFGFALIASPALFAVLDPGRRSRRSPPWARPR